MIYLVVKINLHSQILTAGHFKVAVAQLLQRFTGEGHTETNPRIINTSPDDGVTHYIWMILSMQLPVIFNYLLTLPIVPLPIQEQVRLNEDLDLPTK
jgi:hypothetical protein